VNRLLRTKLLAPVAALLVLALSAAGCGVLGGDADYEVAAQFERTYNLFPGSPVRVLGVEVGKVTELSIEPGSEVVTATMLIDGDVAVPVDAAALIVPESLLGERYVQFEPAYTGGEALDAGATIPVERTVVPFEFDEVLEGLNQFVGGLDAPEVGRMFDNLSTVLDGQGRTLGKVIDQARDAIGVLKDNDDELVALASRLADLNETLATRDQALGAIIEDWNTVTATLASDRTDIDGALRGLVRVTDELGSLLASHGDHLRDDIDVLARVGRTANRNLDNISMMILGGAELFRHAERIIDREHNWMPLQNHSQSIAPELARTIGERLYGVCLRAGMTQEECDQIPIDEILGNELCLDPIAPCPEDGSTKSVPEGVRDVLEASPELRDAIRDNGGSDATGGDGNGDDDGDGLGGAIGDLLGRQEASR
jgi:phospholipid/cholesterol/gamma-HCH transport system substrate-binding protein